MSPVWAVWKKDLKSFLTNPTFYALAGLCAVLWAAFFSFELYAFVQRSFSLSTQAKEAGLNIHQHLVSDYVVIVHYVLIFIIAAMSLRFFAEEKKMKTFPILLSSPMTSWQIVFAKWLVGASLILILLLFSFVLPISLVFFIDIPLKLLFLSYFGVFIILCVYMSAGLLASILTESLIVCVVMSLVFTISILLLGVGREFTEILEVKKFFNYLAFDQHFTYFRKGVFKFSSVIYFLSWSLFLGFLTERIVESHRWR